MALAERVRVARRFLRSIRIDSDIGSATALEGFVCPESSAAVLLTMAHHVAETRQGAFTWTGPYGGGKSSLVVVLGALLNGNARLRQKASAVFDRNVARSIWKALPTGIHGWHVVPVVGRREEPVRVIGEAVRAAGLVTRRPPGGWTESSLIRALTTATKEPEMHGGVILFLDEMGKFLEAAAKDGSDIYVFQQLAEAASRSEGRFLVIGVLHQAFEEYGHRLSHEARDEWAKIQGRFIDLAVNTAVDEQIGLIARAIESDHQLARPELWRPRLQALPRGDARAIWSGSPQCWNPAGPSTRSWPACSARCRGGVSARTSAAFSAFSIQRSPTGCRTFSATPGTTSCTDRTVFGTICVATSNHRS